LSNTIFLISAGFINSSELAFSYRVISALASPVSTDFSEPSLHRFPADSSPHRGIQLLQVFTQR
jgi:hypothetical protein